MRIRLILPLAAGMTLSAGCGLLPGTGGPPVDECCSNPPPPAWVNPQWKWDEALARAHEGPVAVKVDGGTTLSVHPSKSGSGEVRATGSDGRKSWSSALPDGHAAGRVFAGPSGVYLVSWPLGSSGGTVQYLDPETGKPGWSSPLQALGAQSHSEYSNEIQGEVVDGYLILCGDEAHGQYIEVYSQQGDRRQHQLRLGMQLIHTAEPPDKPPRMLMVGPLVETSDGEHQWSINLPGRGLVALQCEAQPTWKAGRTVRVFADLAEPNVATHCTLR